jgi:hypothetical protein
MTGTPPLAPLTVFKLDDGKPRPWAVTLNDYDLDAGSVTIAMFDTEEERKLSLLPSNAAGPLWGR